MAEADPAFKDAPVQQEIAESDAAPLPKRKWGRLALMLSLPLALLIGGLIYWQSLQGQVSTDNAYVHLDKVSVSAEVGGKIVAIGDGIRENAHVNTGALLFRIDPEPYQLQLAQADAAIATAQASETALANSSALSGADIAAAQERSHLPNPTSPGKKRCGSAALPPRPPMTLPAIRLRRHRMHCASPNPRRRKLLPSSPLARRCPVSIRRLPPPAPSVPRPSLTCGGLRFGQRQAVRSARLTACKSVRM